MQETSNLPIIGQSVLLQALDHDTAVGIKLCEYSSGEYRITYANKGFANLSGYSREELVGKNHRALIRPEDQAQLDEDIEEQCSTKQHFRVVYPLKRKDGTLLWMLDEGVVLPQQDGTILVQSSVVDITEQTNAKLTMEDTRKRYEIALGYSNVAIFEYNLKTKKITTPDNLFDICELSPAVEKTVEEVIVSGAVAPRSQNDLRNFYRRIDEGAPSSSATIYAQDVHGNERIVELQLIRTFADGKEYSHALGVRKDITDSVRFRQEEAYGDQLTSESLFLYEANVTRDKIIHYNPRWAAEANISSTTTLSEAVKFVCNTRIVPEDIPIFAEKQSRAFLLDAFARGEQLVTFEYRRQVKNGRPAWVEAKINIIEDELTGDITMRVYVLNIDAKKKGELQLAAERHRYELALSKSTRAYEVNVTKDTLELGTENIRDILGTSYDQKNATGTLPAVLRTIHPLDRAETTDFLSYANLKKSYAAGKTYLVHDCRRITDQGAECWVRFALQLFEDTQTNDLMCYTYVEDINEDKKAELALLYRAQHDLMTGLYNKNTTQEKIEEILTSEKGSLEKHIFFIIDLDYFKLINDRFGHAFGDAVLSQTSAKIGELFRTGDIIGRIGGDEFVVFMSNIKNEKIAFLKAQELCDSLAETYTQNGVEQKMTASVGIALYDKHGKTYDELYRHSDTALYHAKEQGRCRYSLYNETMRMGHTITRDIDFRQIIETSTFESNMSEYVFRILYESNDKQAGITSVLELIGKHYHVSRAYVFENSEDGQYVRNTFEWCNDGIPSQIQSSLKEISYRKLGDYEKNFGAEGVFYLADSNDAPEGIREILKTQNIKSMVQFSIVKDGQFAGFIGFDECTGYRTPEDREFNDYRNFANILGVFITEMRAFKQAKTSSEAVLSIVNGLDSCAYVCDPITHKLLFINDQTLRVMPGIQVGDYCYEALWDNGEPCENCPMQILAASGKQTDSSIRFHPVLKYWAKVTASWVDWIVGTKGCLINSVDVSDYHPENLPSKAKAK
ncbi:MAG: sensor domain-containing diguanylate cyclase [Raoultibacter sp.]